MDRLTLRPPRRHRLVAHWLLTCALAVVAVSSVAHAADAERIVTAGYADPVERYGHFAPGRPYEYARVEVRTAAGAKRVLALPETEVFEDVAPRLVRLAAGEPVQLLAVISHRDRGAALALLGLDKGRLTVVARSNPIGTPMRWLNPVAVADLDGDGIAEIAAVITPHIGGTLKIYHRTGDKLDEIAALGDFSNHVYGSAELGLSALLVDHNGTRLLVPNGNRTHLRVIEFKAGSLRETGRCSLMEPISGPIVVLAGGDIEIRQPKSTQRLRAATCPP